MDNQMQGIQQAAQQLQAPQQGPSPSPIAPLQEQNDQAVQQALKKKRQELLDYATQAPPQQQSAISQAAAQLGDKSTRGQVGKAISTDSGWANLCEAYAEKQIYGKTGIFPDAYSAYQAHAQQGNISTSTKDIPKGAQIFWSPDSSNGGNGHTMVSNGDGTFKSPLSDGSIRNFTIKDWSKFSGQGFLGWAPPPTK